MATTSIQHNVHEMPLQIGRLRALGFGMICGAMALSGLGCVRAERGSFETSYFNAVPYQMPSSGVP